MRRTFLALDDGVVAVVRARVSRSRDAETGDAAEAAAAAVAFFARFFSRGSVYSWVRENITYFGLVCVMIACLSKASEQERKCSSPKKG